MPDISKINALAIGNVAKVDGLAKASILDIDGVAVPAAVAPPLDTYTGAAAAYSVRLLRTAYTGDIMRVRRASDNVEADVGFDGSNKLSLTSPISNTSDAQSYTDFADFVDHTGTPTNAFCRSWYDQSGNSNDAGQSTAGSQPKVYDATTGLITENGKPALDFDGSNDFLDVAYRLNLQNVAAVSVQNFENVLGNQLSITLSEGINLQLYMHYNNASNQWRLYYAGQGNTFVTASTGQQLQTFFTKSSDSSASYYTDGTSIGSFTQAGSVTSANDLRIGAYTGNSLYTDMTFQEFILWPSDQDSNRTGIESNVNGYFSIY